MVNFQKMLNALKDLDLKSRIAMFTVAIFICAIGLLARDLDEEVGGDFQKVLAAQQFSSVEHIANSLDEAAKLRIRSLVAAASLIDPDWLTQPDRLHAFMSAQKPLLGFFDLGMLVISAKGIGLADLPNIAGREGKNYSNQEYFQAVMTTGNPVIGKPVRDAGTKNPVISIGVPIRNRANEIVGILAGSDLISGGDFLGEILPRELRTGGDWHVVSLRDGVIVASTNRTLVLQGEPAPGVSKMYGRYKQGYEGSGISTDSDGIENLVSGKRVTSTNWLVMATLPTKVAFAPIATQRREIYKDAALASVVIALLLWAFLYRQLTPLARSAATLDAMAHGRVALAPLPVKGGKEIRRLLSSFNELQQHISGQEMSLRKNAEQLQLAASVFDGSSEAILISAADNTIIGVNRVFCRMTGYEESELIGQNPRLLQSGRHDRDFYQEMWTSLWETGLWQGEIWNRRKNGEIYPERLSIATLYDAAGKVQRRIAIAADISRQKQAEELIWQQANHNLLTGLPNRQLLQERAHQALEKARRGGEFLALLHVDLDHFNGVNDTLGHSLGDQMIIQAGSRIAACAGTDAVTVAHLGADEFIVVLCGPPDSSSRVEGVAAEILRAMTEPFLLGRETVYISVSIGITLYPGDAGDVAGLLVNANQARQVAKSEGRNRYCRFTTSMQQAAQNRVQLANDMRGALAAHQFEVYYQPILDLASGRVVKAEALLRWHHPERGMVSPAEFIPIAEETGLIGEIGDWVFKEAAQMAKRWCGRCVFSADGKCTRSGAGEDKSCLYQVTVNKSPRQFFAGNTDRTWLDYLREQHIYSECITIEITEGLLLDRNPEVMEKFNVFRDAGIQVALDDFGTGYSAMSYLKKFDIDYIKIDQSFVRDIATDKSDQAIAEAIIVMAHKLGLRVVAEGVETAAQFDLLLAAGCDYGQGYLFSRPVPAAQFESFIAPSQVNGIAGPDNDADTLALLNFEIHKKEYVHV